MNIGIIKNNACLQNHRKDNVYTGEKMKWREICKPSGKKRTKTATVIININGFKSLNEKSSQVKK